MEQVTEWIFRGIAACLVAAFAALFGRLRHVENTQARLDQRVDALEGAAGSGSLDDIRSELKDLRLLMEREFVRREEWVPHISRMLGAMEDQGRQLARLDERLKARD